MKRIDTHSHPNMSKHFAFDGASVTRMVRMAQRVGLDAVALTEHFHAREFWAVHEHLAATYPSAGGAFDAGRVTLLPGAELNIREGAHVILLAEADELRRLDRAFPWPLSRGYEPALREFLDVSDGFELVRIGAHMFRPGKELGKFAAVDLRRLHALEINGKDFGTELMLLVQARALGLPVVAGSDAHHWLQLGVRHTMLHADELTLSAVSKAIKEGLTGYGVGAYTPARVKTAKSLKTITKMLRNCYGWRGRSGLCGRAAGGHRAVEDSRHHTAR